MKKIDEVIELFRAEPKVFVKQEVSFKDRTYKCVCCCKEFTFYDDWSCLNTATDVCICRSCFRKLMMENG